MRCPYCSTPAFEGVGECQRCGLSLDKLDSVFGAVPRFGPGVTDLAGVFTGSEKKKVEKSIAQLEKKFPQVGFSVIITRLKPGEGVSLYAFWIFNRAGISPRIEAGPANHSALLMIDAANARASLIIGYGLEPFLGERHLRETVSAAAPSLNQDLYLEGVQVAIAKFNQILTRVCSTMGRTYGVDVGEIYLEDNAGNPERRNRLEKPPY